jgi:hypothetical protein
MLFSLAPILGLLLASTPISPSASAMILSCDMGPPPGAHGAPSVVRVFRISPGSFQEWRPATQRFGNNLCLSFPCAREQGHFRGVIRSSTLEVTIEADPAAGVGSWKALGASGHSRTNGPCRVQPETSGQAPHG